MKYLINNEEVNVSLTKEETKHFFEQFSNYDSGICIRFKDGTVRNVKRRKSDGAVILVTHEPMFEFEDENELYEYLPLKITTTEISER